MTTSAKLARDSHSKSSYDQIHGTFAPAKCTGISHENYDPRKFNSRVSYEIYDEVFKEAPPVEEIFVELHTLPHTYIPTLFSDKHWGTLLEVSLTLVLSCSASSTLNIVPAGETVKCYVRRVEFIVTPARLHFAFETSSIYEALHIDTMTLFLEIVGLAMGF